jgi:hypothetical protein
MFALMIGRETKFWVQYVIVPIVVALIGASIFKLARGSPGGPLQSGNYPVSTNISACADGENRSVIQCPWAQFALFPKARDSRFKIEASVDVQITVAQPTPNTNGCTADPATGDPWRNGFIYLGCGTNNPVKSEGLVNTAPGHARSAYGTLRSTVYCETNDSAFDVTLKAEPRGCSSMTLTRGTIHYEETAK